MDCPTTVSPGSLASLSPVWTPGCRSWPLAFRPRLDAATQQVWGERGKGSLPGECGRLPLAALTHTKANAPKQPCAPSASSLCPGFRALRRILHSACPFRTDFPLYTDEGQVCPAVKVGAIRRALWGDGAAAGGRHRWGGTPDGRKSKQIERTTNMKTERNIALAVLGLGAGTALLLTQAAWSDGETQAFKLEGTWIAKLAGTTVPAWTYNISPSDPSGRRASFQAEMLAYGDPTFGGAFDAEYQTGFMGEAVLTGPNEAVFTIPNYGIKKVGGVPQLVYIVVDSGTIKRTAPGKVEVIHNLAIYLPAQDADGDGLPDQGQAPMVCVPNILSVDTRLPLLPPCTPPPAL